MVRTEAFLKCNFNVQHRRLVHYAMLYTFDLNNHKACDNIPYMQFLHMFFRDFMEERCIRNINSAHELMSLRIRRDIFGELNHLRLKKRIKVFCMEKYYFFIEWIIKNIFGKVRIPRKSYDKIIDSIKLEGQNPFYALKNFEWNFTHKIINIYNFIKKNPHLRNNFIEGEKFFNLFFKKTRFSQYECLPYLKDVAISPCVNQEYTLDINFDMNLMNNTFDDLWEIRDLNSDKRSYFAVIDFNEYEVQTLYLGDLNKIK